MAKYLKYVLVLIPSLLIFISIFRKSNSFINLWEVCKKHFRLFRKSKNQIILFYILPLFLATGLMLFFEANQDFCENVNIIVSIILSMLFAICSIIGTKDYSSSFRTNKNCDNVNGLEAKTAEAKEMQKRYERIRDVAGETFNAIVFTTIIALLLIFICLAAIVADVFTRSGLWLPATSTIIYYLLIVTILNLFLIVKRMQKLFDAMLEE